MDLQELHTRRIRLRVMGLLSCASLDYLPQQTTPLLAQSHARSDNQNKVGILFQVNFRLSQQCLRVAHEGSADAVSPLQCCIYYSRNSD